MMSLVLRSFKELIFQPVFLGGLIALTIGIALFFSAKNIARTVRKTKDIKLGDKAVVIPFIIGILLFCGGIIAVLVGTYSAF